jgi:hypothetical protein|tara:strand:- start:454 stop:774 length:321 start_codon:yes stop_codon:yes gene_type:complete
MLKKCKCGFWVETTWNDVGEYLYDKEPIKEEKPMGKMAWVSHLTEQGDRDELIAYLMSDCYFKDHRQAELAADSFLDAQKELEEEGIWKSAPHVDIPLPAVQKKQK